MVSVGSIVSGAFRLVKERPGAVAAWGLVYLVATIVMAYTMRPFYEMQLATAEGTTPERGAAASAMGVMLLVQLGYFLVIVVLLAAAQRAVLRPAESDFAFLRLGADELRLIAISLMFGIVSYIALAIGAVVLAFAGIVAMGPDGGMGFILLFGVGILAMMAVWVWLTVRLSLVYSLTVLRRAFVIGESWTLTRGRFWTLFGAYLVIFLVLLVLWAVVAAVSSGPLLLEFMEGGFSAAAWDAMQREQLARQVAGIDPVTIFGWCLGAVLGALYIALSGGAVATVTRELAGTPEDELIEAFA